MEATTKKTTKTYDFENAFFRISIIQTILAVIGMATGCIALYAALNESNAVRKQQQAVVLPIIQIGIQNYNPEDASEEFKLSFKNAGIGPAVIKSLDLSVDNTLQNSWADFFKAIGIKSEDIEGLKTSSVKNRIISPQETVNAVHLDGAGSQIIYTAFNENFTRLSIKSCYCSVFEDCWIFDSTNPTTYSSPKAVKNCN